MDHNDRNLSSCHVVKPLPQSWALSRKLVSLNCMSTIMQEACNQYMLYLFEFFSRVGDGHTSYTLIQHH